MTIFGREGRAEEDILIESYRESEDTQWHQLVDHKVVAP